jgi:hypothetical protein
MKPSEIARIVIAAAWGAALVGSIAMKGWELTIILSGALIVPGVIFTVITALGRYDD